MVRVLGVEDGDGEDAAGLVAVLVLGLVEDVVLADAQDVARKLGGHHVLDLDVVGEDRLLPGDLKKSAQRGTYSMAMGLRQFVPWVS